MNIHFLWIICLKCLISIILYQFPIFLYLKSVSHQTVLTCSVDSGNEHVLETKGHAALLPAVRMKEKPFFIVINWPHDVDCGWKFTEMHNASNDWQKTLTENMPK